MLQLILAALLLHAPSAFAGELSDAFKDWQGKASDAWHGQFMTLEVEGDGSLKVWRPCEDSSAGMFLFFDVADVQTSLRASQGGSVVIPNLAAALALAQKMGLTRVLVKRDDELDLYDLKASQKPVTVPLAEESTCHAWLKKNVHFNGFVLAIRKNKLLVGTTAEPLNIQRQAAVYKESGPGKLDVVSLLMSTEVDSALGMFELTVFDAAKTSQIAPGSPVLIE